ncbi:MAG: ATP-binding cassette domain-containing protein [Verrucomicrobiae bacterium]|nr:ATP-binding cassette domain-containing protein [Verrucomicrobiae bacterium]MCP5538792.1 ATP-binding cassette domain-containing protein [Akkermansiaceae bacterium]MCP5549551.1 ATP-binding cassette domain-containing protein [Akkermansiaceae bacterium]
MSETAPSPPVLRVQNLSVVREGRSLLEAVDWTVMPGEHWALLGANGSGKTSLLNVLLGYLTPTRGEVTLAGREAAADRPDQQWDAWRRNIGFVSAGIAQLIEPGEPALDIVLAGRYAMVNYWRQRTPKRDRADAETELARVECAHLAGQPWMFLSQGERQRVLVGRALMSPDLRLLVLDEPCAGLDPVAREHFLDFVARLVGSKTGAPTLLMVTHHVEEILPAITHALVLREGRVIARGERDTVLTEPVLSQAFGAPVTLGFDETGRRRLAVKARRGRVF